MPPNETRSLLTGPPVAVDVAAIEQELTSFWKSASEGESSGAVIRACSCNLIVLAQNRPEADTLTETLAKVSEWHPCRSIIAFLDDSAASTGDGPTIRAWITAQCRIPVAGGPQVCSEAITLAAAAAAVEDLPNTLVSLLVPDLPVFLYWRSLRAADVGLVDRIARFIDLLIVDSHTSKDDAVHRDRLLELLMDPPRSVSVRDLNWCRLTAWRDLVAQFFDPPSSRHCLREIAQVVITRTIASPGNVPTRTLLLAGWLAGRLKWLNRSARRIGDDWISTWSDGGHEVRMQFRGHPAKAGDDPGISRIDLQMRDGSSFSVAREAGSSCLTARAVSPSGELVHSVPQETMDESSLLVRELSFSGEDSGFQSALAVALELEKAFRSGPSA
jgi:glucose-6-phosphate dehydrogenase assembly protein OpcA